MEMGKLKHFIFFIMVLLIQKAPGMKVSFYGSSYITMPLQEAKMSTNIRLKFKTQQESAIIIFAAGRTDYCLLRLNASRINLKFKIGNMLIEIWTTKSIILNDNMWHEVVIHRYDSNVTMQVDSYFMVENFPGSTTEFNVHFGIFLGGLGEFSEIYLDAINSFRGCLSDVFYNNINVLKKAKEQFSHVSSVRISWNCSSEFDAKITDSFSFIDNTSYVKLSRFAMLDERWNFDIKTTVSAGSIFYNIGRDLIIIDVFNKRIRILLIKDLNYIIELISDIYVSDGNWHNVSYRQMPSLLELRVDGDMKSTSVSSNSSSPVDYKRECYFGAHTEDINRKLLQMNSHTEKTSFKGCLRNILYNNEVIGLPNMETTHEIQVDCMWKYPCIEKFPCILTSICRQYGMEDFICDCDQAFCIKTNYSEPYKVIDPISETALLQVTPICLTEGGIVFLSTYFIKILVDITKYDISDSSVLFNLINPPKHGQLFIYNSKKEFNKASNKSFSLKEINMDKVKYIHNGMENFNDHMTIDLQFTSGWHSLPNFLRGKHRLVLHFNITPVNDPPILNISENRIFHVVQGIPKTLKSNYLSVIDPDSAPHSLIYSIITPIDSTGNRGRFEVNGIPAKKFSQADINQGYVTYIYDMLNVFESTFFDMELQVSDGIETSKPAYFSISVRPLELRLVNNTGLILVYKSSAILASENLFAVTNSEEDIDIRYNLVKLPKYGYIQKFRSVDSSWISVESFTNSQIALNQIRYYHSNDLPVQDEFKFTVSYGKILSQIFDFRIGFTKLKVEGVKQKIIHMDGLTNILITDEYLVYRTTPQQTFARNIIYKIVEPTKYGSVYVDGQRKAAKEKDSFTQLDIEKKLLRYTTLRSSYSAFTDELSFIVSVLECEDMPGKLKIIYKPEKLIARKLIRHRKESLVVEEGGKTLLQETAFEIYFDSFTSLTIRLSLQPFHGSLCKYDSLNQNYYSVSEFSLENLDSINYCHDDTESKRDTFELLIYSDEETDFQYICNISVEISLVNDNAPYRQSENTLHIVRNSTKLIASEVLSYADIDIDTNSSNIKYMRITCNMGKFYKLGKHVNHFTQFDIDSNIISFHHESLNLGSASFIVTDGVFEVPGVLEIEASVPFVKVPHSNTSVVQESKSVMLTKTLLPLEINLNATPTEINYEITKRPLYGSLYLQKNTTEYKNYTLNTGIIFTREDVIMGYLHYHNSEIASMDQIRYRVSVKNITAEGELLIRIYSAAYWEPLHIKKNETLYVEESTSVLITKGVLEVGHPNISPGDVTYLVTEPPLHGYLEVQSMSSDDEFNCKVFDQSAINTEKLSYIHAGLNQSSDFFIFDVTNGISWLRSLTLKVIIIPENLYIKAEPLTVKEGKSAALHCSDILPLSEYYKTKILEYKIIHQPTHGFVTTGKSKINRFTQKQLDAGFVQYIHDGSEAPQDLLKLVGVARAKESVPFDLAVFIIAVNDEVPAIVTNTGLQIWNGGRYVIKNTDIMALDYDSRPDELIYYIGHVHGGYLAYNCDYKKKIDHFKQSEIDGHEIIFVHDANSKTNEFSFVLSDGLFNITEQTVSITVKPVSLAKVHNELLHVFPMTRKQVLANHLLYTCSDESQQIRFKITVPPQQGRILSESDGEILETLEFSQEDINNGLIYYEHITAISELKTNDSFVFDVKVDLVAHLLDQNFNIEISVSSGGLLRFMTPSELFVDEGGSMAINLDFSKMIDYLKSRAGIAPPELYVEIRKPSNGFIEYFGEKLEDNNRLQIDDFKMGNVCYTHDHSDTLSDRILMSIYLLQGNIFLCNLSIPVFVAPVNDQPFHLITASPSLSVVEGETCIITTNNLQTEDIDSSPNEIVYEVIHPPDNGSLLKLNEDDIPVDLSNYDNQFTQNDINNNRIMYKHSGSPDLLNFHFKVSDGRFEPISEIFSINIFPVSIKSHNDRTVVKIPQGEQIIILNENHTLVDTNVQKYRLMYNITNSPLSGLILLDRQPTLRFTQKHLSENRVSYMQTDLNKSNDTFQFVVYINNTSCGVTIDAIVIVEPFIRIDPVLLKVGERVKLTSSFLMANPSVLKFNKYNPKFLITKSPRKGYIKKIIKSSGDAGSFNSRTVNFFTFKELNGGIIYFETKDSLNPYVPLFDSFEYILSFKIVQPAQSVVPVEIKEQSNYSSIHISHSAEYNDIYLAVFCFVLLIIALVILIIMFIVCKHNRLKEKQNETTFPPELPQLPEFTAVNDYRIYSADIESAASLTPLPGITNVPQCRIIPVDSLNEDSMEFEPSEKVNNERISKHQYQKYYENDNWSFSCDIANDFECTTLRKSYQNTNPLLRRNQYWV